MLYDIEKRCFRSIGVGIERDFASLLDDLIEEAAANEGATLAPSLRFDMLEQIERIRAETPALGGEEAIRSYELASAGMQDFQPIAEPVRDVPLPTDRASIERELAITTRSSRIELDRLRRDFARRNHPDGVASHLRQRAMVRMQIANMLIDEARDRLPRP